MEITKINVALEGLADIMFDRFIDYSKDEKPPETRLYLDSKKRVVIPTENIQSFFAGENPPGCAKAFEGKGGKGFIRLVQSHIVIQPTLIPILHDGKEVVFEDFDDESIWWISDFTPRTKQGSMSIKQEAKMRPVLRVPWSVNFQVNLVGNKLLTPDKLRNWLDRGGIEIAIGTYRPRFGRFLVKTFEIS